MIPIWRLTKVNTVEKAFDGEGARLYGERWNQKGTPIVYTASTIALCALEVLVHVDSDLLPKLYLFKVEIPEEISVGDLEEELPLNWRESPAPEELQDIGTNWVKASETALLRIPSAVIPFESNFLLNPNHPDFRRFRIGKPELFEFDPRLRKQ